MLIWDCVCETVCVYERERQCVFVFLCVTVYVFVCDGVCAIIDTLCVTMFLCVSISLCVSVWQCS